MLEQQHRNDIRHEHKEGTTTRCSTGLTSGKLMWTSAAAKAVLHMLVLCWSAVRGMVQTCTPVTSTASCTITSAVALYPCTVHHCRLKSWLVASSLTCLQVTVGPFAIIILRPRVAGTEAPPTQIHSAGSLSAQIYHQVAQPKACFRLLNSSGIVGCAAEQVEAPLQIYRGSLDSLAGAATGAYSQLCYSAQTSSSTAVNQQF